MSWRAIALYYAIAAVLGLNLVRVWVDRAEVSTAAEEMPVAPLLAVSADEVGRVHLMSGDVVVNVVRRGGRWQVLRPPGATISSDLVDALLDALSTLPPVQVVADTPEGSAQFGLAPPRTEIRVATADGTANHRVLLGSPNPTRTAVYASRGDEGPLYLMGLNAQYYVDLIMEQAASTSRHRRGR